MIRPGGESSSQMMSHSTRNLMPNASQSHRRGYTFRLVDGTPITVELGETIGEGNFGTVRVAMDSHSNHYACKVLLKSKKYKESDLKKEIQIHRSLRHEHIVRFLSHVETPTSHMMLMEYGAGGELFDRIAPDVGIGNDLAHFYFHQLVNAVEFMHDHSIAHRDLKPENILLDNYGNLKVSDFGFATVFRSKGVERLCGMACGTPPYVAPEIHTYSYRGSPVDIWSSGIILYVLLCGNTAWDEPTAKSPDYTYYVECRPDRLNFSPWNTLSSEALLLICRILEPNPDLRFTIDQIRRDKWFDKPNRFGNNGVCQEPYALIEALNGAAEMDTPIACSATPNFAYSQPEFLMDQERLDAKPIVSFSQPLHHVDHHFAATQTYTQPQSTQHEARLTAERLTRVFIGGETDEVVQRLSEAFVRMAITSRIKSKGVLDFLAIDKRKCPLRGEIYVQPIQDGIQLVQFRRSKGDPIEFKRFFKHAVAEAFSEASQGPSQMSLDG